MRFSELNKNSQKFLIDQFSMHIDQKAAEEGVKDYQEPTFEEYEDFFNDYDQDYEMVNGYPESTVDDENRPTFRIEFENGNVFLNVYEREFE